jgi:NH3-dependent NAD+ synthetase
VLYHDLWRHERRLQPLKDAYKTTICPLALAQRTPPAHRPGSAGAGHAERIITKPPSELRPDQKDEDSLPP